VDGPPVPLGRILGALGIVALTNFGVVGMVFFVSIWFQRVDGRSALLAGVLLLPFTATGAAAGFLSGRAINLLGLRATLLGALVLEIGGLLGISRLESSTPYLALWPFLVLVGVSLGSVLTAMADVLVRSAPRERGGLMSGLQTAANQVGAVLAIALLGSVVASTVGERFEAATGTAPSAAVRADLAQGIAPEGRFHEAGLEAFSEAVGVAVTIGAGAVAVALVIALVLTARRAGRAS
jgi:MFS family permease